MQRLQLKEYSALRLGIWEFPKISRTLFWGPYSKDPAM